MNIHDLSNEQFQSLLPEINNDIYIISDTGTIRIVSAVLVVG